MLSGSEYPSQPSTSKAGSCGFRMLFGKAGWGARDTTGEIFHEAFQPGKIVGFVLSPWIGR